jgi:hypothetical protein
MTPWVTHRPVATLAASLLAATAVAYIANQAFVGWYPSDDGMLALAAADVLDGGLPHVTYNDPYPGLQAFINAAAFGLFGISLRTLRYMTVVISLCLLVVIYLLLGRVLGRLSAAMIAVATVFTSIATYPTPMPTWLTLPLILTGTWVLLRFWDSAKSLGSGIAGLLIGIAILIKQTAVYPAVALGLWVLARSSTDKQIRRLLGGASVLAGMAMLWVILEARSWSFGILLGLPWSLWLVHINRLAAGTKRSAVSSREKWQLGITFGLSTLLPLAAYTAFYIAEGNIADLIRGVFLTPQVRFSLVRSPSLEIGLGGLGLVAMASILKRSRSERRGAWGTARLPECYWIGLAMVGIVVAGLAAWRTYWYVILLFGTWLPLIIAHEIAEDGRGQRQWIGTDRRRRSGAWDRALMAGVAVAFAFVQIPLWNGVYVAYVFGIALPAVAYVTRAFRVSSGPAVVLLVAASVVGVRASQGWLYVGAPQTRPLAYQELSLPRGGILVPSEHVFYESLVGVVAKYRGAPIWAGPDSPEIYFLSDAANLTGTIYEFLRPDNWEYEELGRLVEKDHVEVVVVNEQVHFSEPVPEPLRVLIAERYPRIKQYGSFTVYERSQQADGD